MENTPVIDASAIIISLNSKRFLEGCIDSLKASEWRSLTYEIIVVDNGSTDGSLEILSEKYPDVKVIANGTNIGFCPAGNLGATAARGRHLLFLNDDIIILDDAIARLVEWMDLHPQAGITGSRLLNIDGTEQHSSGRTYPSPMNAIFGRKSVLTRLFPNAPWARRYLLSDRIQSQETYEVDWVSAAAMMVRADVFRSIGGLAEDFYYFHEMLICRRSQLAGYGVYLDPQSKIIHYEGAGSGVRTARVRRKHIERFHRGAYDWYCLHHGIGRLNPVRFLAAALLTLRATALIAADTLRGEPKQAQAGAGDRPEGGVAI
jgi:GT2 family glycosyltransferase